MGNGLKIENIFPPQIKYWNRMSIITRESLQILKQNYILKQYNSKIDSIITKITNNIVHNAKYGCSQYNMNIKDNLEATYDAIINGAYSTNTTEDMAFMDDILYKLKEIFPDSDIQFLETTEHGITKRTLMIKWD